MNDESKEIRNFIIIFVIVILVVVGIYFFTKLVVKKDTETSSSETKTEETTKDVEINQGVAIVGTMLKKADKKYFVMLYDDKGENSDEYAAIESEYGSKNPSTPLYYVDLGNELNKKYYDKDNINLTADNINDLRFGDFTVLKVENGKITKTYTTVDSIKKVLGLS